MFFLIQLHNLFYKILKDKNIEFYKVPKQLKTYQPKEEQPVAIYPEGQSVQQSEQPTSTTKKSDTNKSDNLEQNEPVDLYISGLDL